MSDAILNTSIPHHEDAFTEISEIPNTKDLNSNDDNSSAFQDLQIESQKEESVSLKDKNDGASHSQDGKSLLSQEEEEEDDEKKDIIMNGPVVEGSLEDSFLQAEADVTLSSDSVESVVLESRCGDVPINDTGQCTLCCSCLSPNLDYYDSGIENSSMVNDSTVSQSKEGEFAENNSSSQVLVETDGQRCCDATDGCCETERRIGLCDEESPNHFVDRPNLNENVFVEEPRTDDISLLEQTEAGLKQVEEDSTMDCVCDCADVTTKESCNFSVTTMTPCLELSVENHLVVPVFHGESESVSEETREGSSNGSFNVQVLVEPISDVKTDESDPNPSSSESSDLKASPVAEDTIFLEEVDVDNHPTAVEPPPPPPDAAAAARETPCQSSETDGQLLAPECDHPTPCDSSNVSSNCNEVRQGLVGLSLDCDNLMCSANSADEKPRSDDAVSHFDDVIQGDSAAAKEVDEQSSLSAQEVVVVVDGGGGDVVSEHRDSLVENEQDDVIYDVPVEEEDEEKEEEEEENTPSALEMVEVLDETQALKKEGQCVNRCPSKSKNNNNNNCKEDAQCEEAENVKCGGETSTSLDHKNDMKEENYYEEIKKEHLEFQGHNCRERGVDEGQSLFKRCSLVEEVMSEVERVKQQHDQVLQELNLDIEQLIMPTTPPSVSSPNDDDDDENNSSFSLPETLPAVYPCTEVAPVTEAREHNLSTRTLPPLPIESSPEDLFSASRPAKYNRSVHQSKSVPSGYQSPTQATSPTAVKQWLSRLHSLSSFREKKPRPSSTPSEVISWRWSFGLPEEDPIYMLYDDTYHLHAGSKYGPEDGIYEDLDTRSQRFTMPSSGTYASLSKSNFADRQSVSSSECNEDNSDTESTRSVGSLSVASFKGKLLNFGRKFSRHDEKKDTKSKVAENDGKSDGKLIRLFSKRKGYDLGRIKKKNAIAEVPEEQKLPQLKMSSQYQHPILPPTPTGLTPEQTKRRYIVGTLVQNETSYISSLKRLLNDYKKPLEESSPPIISANKISVMFHRLPEILQCHTEFCISLSTCIKCWDKSESIGEVFLQAFSKTFVLDIYSDYINNFSDAMDLAKSEAKRKSAFTDFLKARQITSHDRLSFFGLMVKPVQRFPQFILILQDLLRHTPQRHHDRMQLQLALTQMETMADMLNERKRESDQAHAVKRILRHVSAKSAAKSLSEGSRFLLREDTLTQLIFNQNGQWMKSKDRKLFLLNDLLVCVSVVGSSSNENNRKSERFSFKWAVPVTEVEVQEDASPILNRMVQAMSTGQSSATKAGTPNGPVEMEGVKSIYQDLNDLLHDFEVTSRIMALVSTLRRSYMDISVEQMQSLSQSIQQAIQKKDEEVKWIDSCCLQFSVPGKSKTGKNHRELLIYQLKSMDTKQEWLTDVRLAQLALDINNSPAWDLPEQDRRPSAKVPLFVKAVPIHSSQDPTEVKCGCYHRTMSTRLLGRRPQDYVWLCSTDGVNCHISVHTLRQMGLREVFNFDMAECRISAMESVPSFECPSSEISLQGDTVWLGTESRRVLVYSGADAEHFKEVGCAVMSSSVLHLKFHMNQVYVALANGTLAVFHRNHRGYWQMKDFQVITLGSDPVTCLLPVNASVYCGCGRKVWVIDSSTAKVTLNHSVQHDHMGSVYTMAHSGIGLWLNLRNTPLVCLYHAETFQHLQDINITSSVRRILNENSRPPHSPRYCCVTILAASWGLLWIGTNVGVVLSIPLPRLQGMPILGRRANVAYHALVGPVSMILVLQPLTMLSSPQTKLDLEKRSSEQKDNAAKHVPDSSFLPINVPSQPMHHHFKSFRLVSKGDSMNNLAAAKTLPRSFKSHLPNFDAENCIYGLYDNLLNVREGVEDPVSQIDEDLRHSDPDLIPSIASTLDRRVRLKSGRPRSLDLANLAGLGEMMCMSSSSEDGGSGSQSLADLPEYAQAIRAQIKECDGEVETYHSRSPQDVISDKYSGNNKSLKLPNVSRSKKIQGLNAQLAQRSVVTLVGGRGYTDLRKPLNRKEKRNSLSSSYYPSDAYAVMWEMKV